MDQIWFRLGSALGLAGVSAHSARPPLHQALYWIMRVLITSEKREGKGEEKKWGGVKEIERKGERKEMGEGSRPPIYISGSATDLFRLDRAI